MIAAYAGCLKKIMVWICCLLLFLLNLSRSAAQVKENFISGTVTDNRTGTPVAGCSVYFSNTSKGDITSATGEFELKNLPAGKYEMVVSAIGYETEVIPVSSTAYPRKLKIGLRIRSAELSEVIVHPFLKNGWEKWGQLFIENFIGTIPNASHCRLMNHEVLKFWYAERTNRLTARADEPLIIENEALGYIIKFKLEEFSSDFDSQVMVYLGYPLFQEMTGTNEKKKTKWLENRKEAFYGSLLEFMRCIYSDRWLESGYHIVTYVTRPNMEKLRIKRLTGQLQQTENASADQSLQTKPGKKDSAAYYKRILKQADSLSTYVSLTSLDSLLVTDDDGDRSLFFNDKLVILYKRFPPSAQLQSEIYLSTPAPINIQQNGSYFSPRELVTTLHWAKFEKVANMLPFDYTP